MTKNFLLFIVLLLTLSCTSAQLKDNGSGTDATQQPLAISTVDKAIQELPPPNEYIYEIQWYLLTYDLIKAAQKENKSVLFFVYSESQECPVCGQMMRETFNNPEVIRLLNKHFYSVLVNGDEEAYDQILGLVMSKRNEYPCTVFIPPGDTVSMHVYGNITAEEMKYLLKKWVNAPKNTNRLKLYGTHIVQNNKIQSPG